MTLSSRPSIKLKDCWLYAVISPADLARRLSTKALTFSVLEINALAEDAGNFKLFDIKNNDGKSRPVQEPKPRLQRLHARVHKLLSRIEIPSYLHSAVKGRSYLSNARAHPKDVALIKIDVKKFFPSVPQTKIFAFFADELRCRRDVAGLLAEILTYEGRLATGSSASPILAYYAFKSMFNEIADVAQEHGLTMTCYVDDMTLSGTSATEAILFRVRKIIAKHGLKSHKARFHSPSDPKVVTGVCIASDGERVPNKLHLKIKNGFDELASAATNETKAKVLRPLIGRMEAAGQIDPKFRQRARNLRRVLKSTTQPN